MARSHRKVICKTPGEIALMRKAGEILAHVFNDVSNLLIPGITTLAIGQAVEAKIREQGAEPLFLGVPCQRYGFPPFPSAACISLNSEIVHGIPSERCITISDIVSIDIGVRWKGWCSDAARTFVMPGAMQEANDLAKVTWQSLEAAIATAKPGIKLGQVSAAIEQVAIAHNCGIIRELVGHGIGREMWELPHITNYRDPKQEFDNLVLQPGMTLAIEPMLTNGKEAIKLSESDGWTISTRDGSLAAHYEDTLLITQNGVEVLTRLK